MKNLLKQAGAYLLVVCLGLGIGYAAPRIPAWLRPSVVEGDFHSYYPDAKTRVLVYGTSWCPYCAKTRAYLDAHHIAYLDLDVEKSALAARQHAALGGGDGIPKVLIGNMLITEFNPQAFDKALARLSPER